MGERSFYEGWEGWETGFDVDAAAEEVEREERNRELREDRSDPRPRGRVVDPECLPLYREVLDCGYPSSGIVTRHHVVPRSQSGDDAPENLIWVDGDGTRGVHGVLETRCKDGATGLTYLEAAVALVEFVEARPELLAYVERRKYVGWLRDRYLSGQGFRSPLERAEYLRSQGRDEDAALVEAEAG